MLSEIEKKVIAALQEDIPITARPYLEIASNIGITEEQFIETLQNLCNKKVIRRFGATIRHQKSGFKANAMTAWRVYEDRIDKVGKIMAASKDITHCYVRISNKDWPYNMYTMIHAEDKEGCHEIARKLSKKIGIDNYKLLFSVKELKKTSMKYFP